MAVDVDLVREELRAVQGHLDAMEREIRALQQRADRSDASRVDIERLAEQFKELSEHVHELTLHIAPATPGDE
jgi:hypothetical protein